MEEIPEELRAVLSDLPAPKKQQVMRIMMAAVHRSGPLPTPEDFARYGETLPDAPSRILGMAERQADHRMALEKLVISSQLNQSRAGQWLAASLGVVCIAASTLLSLHGHEAVAGVLGGTWGYYGVGVGHDLHHRSQHAEGRRRKEKGRLNHPASQP